MLKITRSALLFAVAVAIGMVCLAGFTAPAYAAEDAVVDTAGKSSMSAERQAAAQQKDDGVPEMQKIGAEVQQGTAAPVPKVVSAALPTLYKKHGTDDFAVLSALGAGADATALASLLGLPSSLVVTMDDGTEVSVAIAGWAVVSNTPQSEQSEAALLLAPVLSAADAALYGDVLATAGNLTVYYREEAHANTGYTVDITYGDKTYWQDGGNTTDLRQVAEYLGIEGDIVSASFTNPQYARAVSEGGTWYLESLSPFDTQETLMLVMMSGGIETVYLIPVTDGAVGSVIGSAYVAYEDGSDPAYFTVTMPDGSQVGGYCLNHGLPAPDWSSFDFEATWNGSSYDLFFNTGDAPMYPGQIDVGQGTQNVGVSGVSMTYYGISLSKSSASPGVTDGNPMYSLEGAVYYVYQTWESAYNQTGAIASLVTDANGNAAVSGLNPGTYYVREASASRGYKKDNTIYSVIVGYSGNSLNAAGTLTTLSVSEIPAMDPPILYKIDSVLGKGSGSQGDGTLKDAQFEWTYYAGYFTDETSAIASGTKGRSWVFKSDASGIVWYDNTHYVSGDDLYTGAYGEYTIPLGTVIIREVAAPSGYKVTSGTWIAWIIQPTSGGDADYEWKTEGFAGNVVEEVIRGSVAVDKSLIGADGQPADLERLEGIQIEVVNRSAADVVVGGVRYAPGTVVATLTLDAAGHAEVADLPYGTYELREVEASVPDDIQVWSWTQTGAFGNDTFATVAVRDEKAYATSFTDYAKYPVTVFKADTQTGKGVANTEFTLWRLDGVQISSDIVVTDDSTLGVDDARWVLVGTAWSDAEGNVDFGLLPFGIYKIDETYPNPEYMGAAETLYWATNGAVAKDARVDRIFTLDKGRLYEEQTWLNTKICIETTVDKRTIAVSSIGMQYWTQTDDGTWMSNVLTEKQLYTVAFSNGQTNVYSDEYYVIDELGPVAYGLRVTDLWLPSVVNDLDGMVWVLVRTSAGTGDVPAGTTFAQPELVPGTLCDGTMRFDAKGWRLVGLFSATSREKIDLFSLLANGEYITGIALCFGAVAPGFATAPGCGLAYLMVASQPLAIGTAYSNDVASHNTRNWAIEHKTPAGTVMLENPKGLVADAADSVTTRVINSFGTEFDPYQYSGWSSYWLGTGVFGAIPRTGDSPLAAVLAAIAVAAVATASVAVALRRRKR